MIHKREEQLHTDKKSTKPALQLECTHRLWAEWKKSDMVNMEHYHTNRSHDAHHAVLARVG